MAVNPSQAAYPVANPPSVGGQSSVVSVVVGYIDTNGNFVATSAANGLPVAGGGGGGGGAVTLAAGAVAAGAYVAGSLVDGADATQGLTTDAAVAAGAAGTESAKLRAISRDIGTVAGSYGPVTPTDASGKITTGGTAQQLSASNAARRGYWVQNLSTGDLWINEQGTAVIGASTPQSFKLPANAYFESPVNGTPTEAISIIGATTGQQFAARTW